MSSLRIVSFNVRLKSRWLIVVFSDTPVAAEVNMGENFLESGKLKSKLIFLRRNFLSALPSVFTALNINFESVCRESQRQDYFLIPSLKNPVVNV